MINRIPPRIQHIGYRPENWEELIEDAAKNVHIQAQGTKLLKFYAGQGNGFRPALELIKQKTGIAANKVSEIRKRLVERGLMGYSSQKGIITICWKQLLILAGLPEPLVFPRSGKYHMKQVSVSGNGKKRKKKDWTLEYFKILNLLPGPKLDIRGA